MGQLQHPDVHPTWYWRSPLRRHRPPKEDLNAEWMVDNFHIVGSPQTVADKITEMYDQVGGFGTLISFGHDYASDPSVYRRSFELIGTKVTELVSHLSA